VTSPLRRAVEQRSGVPLAWLATRPRWAPFLVVLALLLGGLFAPPLLGIVLLVALALLLGWLAYLAWPRLPLGARFARVAVLVLIAVAIVERALDV
jgi:hypothetical protein